MQKETPASCSLGGCGCSSSGLGGGAAAIFFFLLLRLRFRQKSINCTLHWLAPTVGTVHTRDKKLREGSVSRRAFSLQLRRARENQEPSFTGKEEESVGHSIRRGSLERDEARTKSAL
jgi:hypothetical protein